MRLFITGASGFIGKQLPAHWRGADVQIAALVEPGSQLGFTPDLPINGLLETIADWRAQLLEWQPDTCIHLAWYAEPGQYLYSPRNIPMLQHSLSLLQTLIEAQCKNVVMVGTCAEYDTDAGYLKEDSPTKPTTIYATAKLALAWMARQMALDAQINLAWARMFYLYGPHENKQRLVAMLINKLLHKERFPATAGEQVRDYIHVADAARALWHLAQGGYSGIYNISSGYPVTVRDLIETVATLLDARHLLDIGVIPYRQWEPMFICGDNHKLLATGWQPQYTLQSGLAETVNWWKEHADD